MNSGIPWDLNELRARSRDNLRMVCNVVARRDSGGIATGCSRLYYAVMQAALAKICERHGVAGLQKLALSTLNGKPHFKHWILAEKVEMAGLNLGERVNFGELFDLRVLADDSTEIVTFEELAEALRVGRLVLDRRLGVQVT